MCATPAARVKTEKLVGCAAQPDKPYRRKATCKRIGRGSGRAERGRPVKRGVSAEAGSCQRLKSQRGGRKLVRYDTKSRCALAEWCDLCSGRVGAESWTYAEER